MAEICEKYTNFVSGSGLKIRAADCEALKTTQLHIARLLEARGYASVPGFGAFVARRESAAIVADGLTAPRCSVAFESFSDVTPDNDLVRSMMFADGIDETRAQQNIARDMEDMRRSLSVDGHVNIGNAGSLNSRQNGDVEFEMSDSFDPCSSWLMPMELTPLREENTVEHVNAPDAVNTESWVRSMRRTASVAAAFAIFVFMAFVFSQLPVHPSVDKHSAGVIPTSLPTQPISADAQELSEPALVLVLNTPADAMSIVDETAHIAQKPVVKPSETGRYCLVVASLASRREAEKYLSTAPDGLEVLEVDGKYRIYSMSDDSFDALQKRARLSGEFERYPTAWICRR